MDKFEFLAGAAAPLMRDNIDTDSIIPAVWLRSIRIDPGKGLFGGWRYDDEGREQPDFILNQRGFRDAKILIAGRNFGCGSSRENAVWALIAFGIRCVVAPSFADIFRENCIKNGLLPVTLDPDIVERLGAEAIQAGGKTPTRVDLRNRTVRAPTGWSATFEIAPRVREILLEGLDDLTRTLRHEAEIEAFQERDRAERPWLYVPADSDGAEPGAADEWA